MGETFSKKLTLKIKTQQGSQECEVVKVKELLKFLDKEAQLAFSVKEKEKIVKLYQVELLIDPAAQKLSDNLNKSKSGTGPFGS